MVQQEGEGEEGEESESEENGSDEELDREEEEDDYGMEQLAVIVDLSDQD
jgi:hypothetical protein